MYLFIKYMVDYIHHLGIHYVIYSNRKPKIMHLLLIYTLTSLRDICVTAQSMNYGLFLLQPFVAPMFLFWWHKSGHLYWRCDWCILSHLPLIIVNIDMIVRVNFLINITIRLLLQYESCPLLVLVLKKNQHFCNQISCIVHPEVGHLIGWVILSGS